MTIYYIIAAFCVLGMSIGQILFKYSANSFASNGINIHGSVYLLIALTIYMVQTFAWVWTLKHISLAKIYPIMAFAFILVPLGSILIFKESYSLSYWIGAFFIVAGIIITTNSIAS